MEKNISRIGILSGRLRALAKEGKASEVLGQARQLLSSDPHELNICHVASIFLIDCGSETNDIQAIDEGIAIIDRILIAIPKDDSAFSIQNRYNQSNGHAYRYRYYLLRSRADLANNALQSQKRLLQELLLRKEYIPQDLLPNVLTNYANCLDHLSRTFEAIDHFLDCLDINPKHGVARGNCGSTIPRVTSWTKQHHLENFLASWDLLSGATAASEDIMAHAAPSAVANLQVQRDELKQRIAHRFKEGIITLEQFRTHRAEAHSAPPAKWIAEALRDRLLLSFNQLPLTSKDEAKDDAFIDMLSYGATCEDEEKSLELLYLLNTIKEAFASARYLYYHATKERRRLKNWNAPTSYANPEGSAEFGLIAGLLKTSFRASVDLLDKIALFIARYFDLDYSEKNNYNINNVWFLGREKKKGVHPILVPHLDTNYPLMGLRDFQRDFFLQEFPGRIKDVRNAAVHRWLTLHWLEIKQPDDESSFWSMEDFASLTLFILRQSKSAVLLLFAAINVAEAHRKRDGNDKVAISRPLLVGKPPSSGARTRKKN